MDGEIIECGGNKLDYESNGDIYLDEKQFNHAIITDFKQSEKLIPAESNKRAAYLLKTN